jgi:hypothetical protein
MRPYIRSLAIFLEIIFLERPYLTRKVRILDEDEGLTVRDL